MYKTKFAHKTAVILLNLLSRTWRLKIKGEIPESPAIIIFWHGFMLPAWKVFSGKVAYGVVSKSRDGAILSDLLEIWGISTVRGSSASGGKELIDNMCALFDNSNPYLLITPDGAKGPIYKIKAGAFVVSQRTSVPIYILTVKEGRSYRLKKSWDKFLIPLPFSKIELEFSAPISTDKNLNREEIDDLIRKSEILMNELYFPKKSS